MIFTEKYTTRWHDTDADRRVRITQMLVYMQETSNFHMESCGPSLDALRDEQGLAFILSKIRMSVYKQLYAFENIEIQTWTCPNHGFAIPRFYRIVRGTDVIAEADSTWALLDLKSGRLVKGDEGMKYYSFENTDPSPIEVPQRFKLPANVSLEHMAKRSIVYSDLDYNMHMNNTKYTDMLCDHIPLSDVGKIKGVFLSYLNEAAYGDELDIHHALSDNVHYFRTVNGSGRACLEAMLILDSDGELK